MDNDGAKRQRWTEQKRRKEPTLVSSCAAKIVTKDDVAGMAVHETVTDDVLRCCSTTSG